MYAVSDNGLLFDCYLHKDIIFHHILPGFDTNPGYVPLTTD